MTDNKTNSKEIIDNGTSLDEMSVCRSCGLNTNWAVTVHLRVFSMLCFASGAHLGRIKCNKQTDRPFRQKFFTRNYIAKKMSCCTYITLFICQKVFKHLRTDLKHLLDTTWRSGDFSWQKDRQVKYKNHYNYHLPSIASKTRAYVNRLFNCSSLLYKCLSLCLPWNCPCFNWVV